MYTVEIQKLIDKLHLENLTPEIPLEKITISQTDVNRPALQLAGYFDYFDSNRIQVIGHVEASYLQTIGHDKEMEMMKKIMDHQVPCIVYCRSIEVNPEVIKMALEYNIPILRSDKTTSSFMAEVIRWLNVRTCAKNFDSWSFS